MRYLRTYRDAEVMPAPEAETAHQALPPQAITAGTLARMGGRIGRETREYAASLYSEVEDHAAAEGQEALLEEAFTDLILDSLEEQGYWPDYQLAYLRRHGAGLNAWGLDPTSRILYLCIADFANTNQVGVLHGADRTAALKRLQGFVKKARRGTLELQEHNPVLDVASTLRAGVDYDSIRCYLLTNRISSAQSEEDLVDGVPVELRTWDLESIRRTRSSGEALEPIVVDFRQQFGEGVPCLQSPQDHPDVTTLLMFMPGGHLARIYHEFGPRLLERNVRSFLMARGKINQGIRDTLRDEPERFLAYNNGLTATASAVDVDSSSGIPRIIRITDLQIVNGGQTTASIAVAARDASVDLDEVFVQVKLAVVDAKHLDELVPSISRYANRQNAVQESDLSANLSFLRHLERASRTEWTPAEATGRPTKWYFERGRGSYAVEKTQAGTLADQRRFTEQYPANQRFGKNELALYQNTWAGLPHIVCRGGQKNFAEYLLRLDWPEDMSDSEQKSLAAQTFRDIVATGVMFKAADHAIHKALGGTYKRAVVTYTLAYLLERLPERPDLNAIWRTQAIAPSMEDAIVDVADSFKEFLQRSSRGRNVTEWAKQEACWNEARSEDFDFVPPEPTSGETDRGAGARDSRASDGRQSDVIRPDRRQVAADLRPLAECIAAVHGEPIEGAWRRYRRRRWRHVGDTNVPTANGLGTLHLYAADLPDPDGQPYTLRVVVDFPTRDIIPVDKLPGAQRDAVDRWLENR